MISRQFVIFAVAGGVAAGVNWLSRMGLAMFMPVEAAIVIAYLIGMTTAYALNRQFVFEKTGRTMASEYWRFGLVNVVALAQVWLVTMALLRFIFPTVNFTWRAEDVAHAIGVLSPIVTSYLGHRHFSFARKRGDG